MNKRRFRVSTLLILSLASEAAANRALAQQALGRIPFEFASPSIAASAVGHWLYDPQGNIVGSVREIADGGRTAVIMVGSYFRPGSYEARVPSRAVSLLNGRYTLQAETVEALAARTRRQG